MGHLPKFSDERYRLGSLWSVTTLTNECVNDGHFTWVRQMLKSFCDGARDGACFIIAAPTICFDRRRRQNITCMGLGIKTNIFYLFLIHARYTLQMNLNRGFICAVYEPRFGKLCVAARRSRWTAMRSETIWQFLRCQNLELGPGRMRLLFPRFKEVLNSEQV